MRAHINHVSKLEFLCGFRAAFFASITKRNIQGGFAGAGLVPYDLERVLSKPDVKLRTLTPLNSRATTRPNSSSIASRTTLSHSAYLRILRTSSSYSTLAALGR